MPTRCLRLRTRNLLPALAATVALASAGCTGAGGRSSGDACRAPSESAPGQLCKCVLLIPFTYNDGTEVPADVLTQIENRLYDRFGGYTIAGAATGTYRMADGTRADDRSLVIWVAVPRERIGELRREVARFGHELRQESMYFEVANVVVEFVGPAEP